MRSDHITACRLSGSSFNEFQALIVAVICLITLSVSIASSNAQDEVFRFTGVDGETFDGKLEAISEDGVITGDGLPEDLTLDALREISSGSEVSKDKPQVIVHLSGGDLYADGITVADDQCKIRSQIGNFEMGIESIRAIRLVPDKKLELFDRALTQPLEAKDQIFVELDGSYQRLEGLLESIDQSSISIEYEGESRQLPVSRIYGFVLAGVPDAGDRKINAMITLKNGSKFVGKIKSAQDSKLQVNAGVFADMSIPISAIARIAVRSSRLVFLSDMEPVEVEQNSLIVSVARPWQRDLSIESNPLTLFTDMGAAQKVYAKGLGTHAGCRLVFKNEGEFNRFAATIGIDTETAGRGDCLFVVQGDGRELFSERVKGTSDARAVEVDIAGVQEVTLLVLPGENLDLADHADWCDARFLKTDG